MKTFLTEQEELKAYKQLRKEFDPVMLGNVLIIYGIIDEFIDYEISDDEYLFFADIIKETWLKANGVSLANVADQIMTSYINKRVTLDELKEMTTWDLMELVL